MVVGGERNCVGTRRSVIQYAGDVVESLISHE
jgi:hypothetical protein